MSFESPIVLTPAGHERIEKELDRLKTTERREVAERIRDSKQFGEYAENAEYEDAKIEQAFVEGRIQELRRILSIARVLDESEIPTNTIGIGSIVTVREARHNEEWEFMLVGSVESDPEQDRISDESPVGHALFGKKVGDSVNVAIPDGHIKYKVLSIRK